MMGRDEKTSGVLRGDTPASIAICLLLAMILAGVLLTGGALKPRSHGERGARGAPSGDLLPDEVRALGLTGSWVYDSQSLYEYINGQAPFFEQFGFQAVHVGEYSEEGASAPALIVDVYDMGARRNARGIFIESSAIDEDTVDIGNDGFLAFNNAGFWKGPFYVRVMALTVDDLTDVVEEAARLVAGRIEDDRAFLIELDAFPSEGRVPGSRSFMRTAAFGLPYMRDVFLASYEVGDTNYRLFFRDMESVHSGADTLEQHVMFMEGNHVELERRELEHKEFVWAHHRHVGPILLIRRGGVLAGAVGIADPVVAEARVLELIAGLEGEP